MTGNCTDPALPAGYAAFGVHVIGSAVYVAYAKQNPLKHDPVIGPGRGYVSQFATHGKFVRRFASAGVLDAPWGVVMAPATAFGAFSGALLIGNFGDGIINAFSPTNAQLLGQIQNPDGTVIHNPGLWDMVFGAGGTGSPTTLYFTSGSSKRSSRLVRRHCQAVDQVSEQRRAPVAAARVAYCVRRAGQVESGRVIRRSAYRRPRAREGTEGLVTVVCPLNSGLRKTGIATSLCWMDACDG